ncbi:MAG: hypothetical protein K0R54_638 [Clostridiaceae bacterium]|jgi:GNAT superfamily N-acetyltransferase|nr:hypothetical protein [Clostridiaceae bacterium]
MNELLHRKIEFSKNRKLVYWELILKHYISKNNNPNEIDIRWIDKLFVDKIDRGRGIATKLLEDFCDTYKESLIFLQAGVLDEEYSEKLIKEKRKDVSDKLAKFYNKRGFVDITEHIETCDDSYIMVYNNEKGKMLLDAFN